MGYQKERSGWLLASIILTGFLLLAHLGGIFEPLLNGDLIRFVSAMFLIVFMGISFTFGLIGYIKKRPSYSLISAIINTVYSFLGLIGFVFIIIGMIYAREFVDVSYYIYIWIFIFVFFLAIIGLIYLVFLTISGYIGYSNQRKINEQNRKINDKEVEVIKDKNDKSKEK